VTLAYLFAPDLPDHDGISRDHEERARDDITPTSRQARDDSWASRIRAGDHDAFAQLYREYMSAMIGFAFRFVRSVQIAEDITEDVFVAVWERRLTWEPRHGARAYLFHAVRTRALNDLRDRATAKRLETIAPLDNDNSSLSLPVDDQLDIEQRVAAARAVIATFPEMRRRIMELRWYNGLAIDEIAVIMEMNRAAVDQHLSRGLRALRTLLRV
jgi:RNA polymerase sigma-70 factor (ECF subfamily)